VGLRWQRAARQSEGADGGKEEERKLGQQVGTRRTKSKRDENIHK